MVQILFLISLKQNNELVMQIRPSLCIPLHICWFHHLFVASVMNDYLLCGTVTTLPLVLSGGRDGFSGGK